MENVLVTAIGSFSADIVIKSLKRMNYKIIGCDIYPKEWIADAYQVHQFYRAPYATNEKEYIKFIKKICCVEKITMIFPLTDIEVDVFNENRKWFDENHITVCISSKETIDICRNKKIIEEYIREFKLNINTIHTEYLNEIKTIPSKYPVVLKPYNGRSSQGLKYIQNSTEWKHILEEIDTSNYIVQPYVEGSIVTVDIVRSDEKHAIAIPRKELLRTLNGAGTSVYVYNDLKLEEVCIALANVLDIIGCVNFEFIIDDNGKYHFIECNPRFSGGVEFSCMTGYDFVKNHVKCFRNKKIDEKCQFSNQYIARKYEEYVTYVDDYQFEN